MTTHPFGLLCATNQRLANRSHRRYDSFTTHAIQPSRGTGSLRPPVPVVADITLAFTASPIAKDNVVVQAARVGYHLPSVPLPPKHVSRSAGLTHKRVSVYRLLYVCIMLYFFLLRNTHKFVYGGLVV